MDNDNKGNKHICKNCSAKFYDLNKNPIICPKCGTDNTNTKMDQIIKEKIIDTDDKKDLDVDNILSDELNEDVSFEEDVDEDKDENIINIE